MHSVNEDGDICVNLNDFNTLSDSIRFREKIDFLTESLGCPPEISRFSISILFHGGHRYYISNLYLWAIPYRTEGLSRGDIDHDPSQYHDKEFFIQQDIQYDTMQLPIIQILESRYRLSTTFAMIRQCPECDFIIEAYHHERVEDPAKLYYSVRDQFEKFIYQFMDAMQQEIITALPRHKWLKILTDDEYRKKVITRQIPIKESYDALTARELQCLHLLAQGMSTKIIASKLYLSAETVTTHAKSIRHKLHCKNITEAVSMGIRLGLL